MTGPRLLGAALGLLLLTLPTVPASAHGGHHGNIPPPPGEQQPAPEPEPILPPEPEPPVRTRSELLLISLGGASVASGVLAAEGYRRVRSRRPAKGAQAA